MSSKAKGKRASIAKSSATPPPLANLCHRALAKGVLELHNGLPDDWLKMFRKHPAAWKQLNEAVLKPMGRQEDWLTKESTVMLVCSELIRGTGVPEAVLVPASALPEWLFQLLAHYFKAWFFSDELFFRTIRRPDKCGLGGFRLDLEHVRDLLTLAWDVQAMCRAHKGALSELHDDYMEQMIKLFEIDVWAECAELMEKDRVAHANHEIFDGCDEMDIVREYPHRITSAINKKLEERAREDIDCAMFETLHAAQREDNKNATHFKAPYATLYCNVDTFGH